MTQTTPAACPRCGRTGGPQGAAFCPYCGAALPTPGLHTPSGARRLIDAAQAQTDPKKKFALLAQAQREYPDCLAVEEALLYLGRLHERDPRKLDFSVIKCHLLHVYLTPEDFDEATAQGMRSELVDGEQLRRCLALAPDEDAFLRRYFARLSAEFVRLFLRGSNRYMNGFFGIRLEGRAARNLAAPTARMLGNILRDARLPRRERGRLYEALYRAYLSEVGGDAQWLNPLLAQSGCPVPEGLGREAEP